MTSARHRLARLLAAALLAGGSCFAAERAVPRIVAIHPHDPLAFTQGLLLHEGAFYESTGLHGRSSLRRVNPLTGSVLQQFKLDDEDFGEGLARVGDRLVQLTYQENRAYVYDLRTFARLDTFVYEGEGWGLCYDGRRLVMSDGSSFLTFRDPSTFEFLGRLQVTLDGRPVSYLNELECVGGLVYANVYTSDAILRIDSATGVALTRIDASGLLAPPERLRADVLNGIAFDPATEHFFLTGKLWPRLFEVTFDFDPYGSCAVSP